MNQKQARGLHRVWLPHRGEETRQLCESRQTRAAAILFRPPFMPDNFKISWRSPRRAPPSSFRWRNMSQDKDSTQSKRILLVDDDAEIIDAMEYALAAKGYTILIARDGNQGLAMAEREDPDLVVLDMMMPKRSGFLVLEKLRRTRETPLRVIMITANEGSRHKAYAEMLGVDEYIRKPFAMDRLVDSVGRLLADAAG